MYGWVLKRTLAAVGHEFLSFISTQKMGRGLFNVESGWLSLCSSSECSSLATACPRALKWSQRLSDDAEQLWHRCFVFVLWVFFLSFFGEAGCASTYIYLFSSLKALHLDVNSSKCFHLLIVWLLCSSAVMMHVIIRAELFFLFKLRRVMVFILFFFQDRNVLIAPHASQTLLMEKCKYSNRGMHEKQKLA